MGNPCKAVRAESEMGFKMKRIIFLFLVIVSSYSLAAIELPFYSHYIDTELVIRLDFCDDGTTILLIYFDESNNLNECKYKVVDAYYHDYNATIRFTIIAENTCKNDTFGEYIDIIGRAGGSTITRGNYGTLHSITMEYQDGSSHMQGYGDSTVRATFSPQTSSSRKAWNHPSKAINENALRIMRQLEEQQKNNQKYWK